VLCIADLLVALTNRVVPDAGWAREPLGPVVTDSREVSNGACFVALRGEHRSGHEFVAEAASRGARVIIMERERINAVEGCWLVGACDAESTLTPPDQAQPLCLVVEDSLAALQEWAAYWRRQHQVRVVGVTGSVGKTTTKEMVYSVLSRRFRTLKSEGNYNNEIGLPLTLLQLMPHHQRVVVEMGMYALGEIAQLAEIAQPAVGVVTNVGPTHLERLGTLERIAQAKQELVEALPPSGAAILNGDDDRVMAMSDHTPARVVCYGLRPDCEVWADEIASRGLEGVRFRLHHGDEVLHVRTPLLGRHSVHTALAAAAVGIVEDESWEEIIAGLQEISAQLRLVALSGPHGSILLDDTYNASPASTIAALNLLGELPGRTIAVLGDMLELGDFEVEGHRKVGRRALEVVDLLITVGDLGHIIGQEALACGMDEAQVLMVDDNCAAITHLRELTAGDDVILVKGSRGMAMEEIVNALAEGPRLEG
jgi:UDP-N-acetylmuramoyl-tripeptide--D-alanyl-D-alanine ligase